MHVIELTTPCGKNKPAGAKTKKSRQKLERTKHLNICMVIYKKINELKKNSRNEHEARTNNCETK